MRGIVKIIRSKGVFIFHLLCAIFLASAFGVSGAAAADYPTKPIEVVVAFSAGGGTDVLMRVVGKYLGEELGQPILVINKPGGGYVPASLDVEKAAPDGYTLMCDTQAYSSFQIGRKEFPVDPLKRTPICKIVSCPYALFGSKKMPWKNLKDVADFIKKTPDKFNWGGIGLISGTNFAQLQFFDEAGADIKKLKMANFKGSGPILAAVAGGHIMFGAAGASAVPPFLSGDKVTVFAVTGDQRVKALSGVPSAKEAGFPGATVDLWIGLSGPPNLPKPIVDRINQAVTKIIKSPKFVADLEKITAMPLYQDAQKFRQAVIAEGNFAKKLRETMGW